MTFAFSPEGYRKMLCWFLDRDYTVVDYSAFDPTRRHLILRHDIDFSLPFAVEIGAIEQELGLTSVHFVQLRSEFYNPLTPGARAMLRTLRDQGHTIGLHFDPRTFKSATELETSIGADASLLTAASSGPVSHVSFHRPPQEHFAGALQLGGLWNAYAARFTTESGYCSDSRGAWMHGDPVSQPAVKEGRALQLLTHPIWWTGDSVDPKARLRQFMSNLVTIADHEIALNCEIHEPGHARIAFRKSFRDTALSPLEPSTRNASLDSNRISQVSCATTKIRTLHVDIEGGWGGSSRSLYELIKRLDRNRISPVVVHRLEGPVSEWYAELGVPTYHVPEIGSFVPRREKALKNFLASLPKLIRLDRAARRIADVAQLHSSAIIHLNYEGLFLLASRLRKQLQLPIVAHSRTYLPYNSWARWLMRDLAASSDHMFFISPQEQQRWKGLGAPALPPGEVLWNIAREPLPREPFRSPAEVVYLGNLERSKGVNRIINIAAAIAARAPSPFVFAIYGRTRSDSSYLKELKRLLVGSGVESIVQFRGHTDHPERVLARAFALLRPSYENDPWGRDVIEAAVSGVPVMATGTFSGVIQNGVNGILMDPFDPERVADWLLELHRDPQTWRRMSETGRASALERFGGTIQATRFAEVAEALAEAVSREPRPHEMLASFSR